MYNIDYLRPEYSDAINYIKEKKPDILGISAVVSTAYEYSKNISLDIKKVLPDTTIILGGNLGASNDTVVVNSKIGIKVLTAAHSVNVITPKDSKYQIRNIALSQTIHDNGIIKYFQK